MRSRSRLSGGKNAKQLSIRFVLVAESLKSPHKHDVECRAQNGREVLRNKNALACVCVWVCPKKKSVKGPDPLLKVGIYLEIHRVYQSDYSAHPMGTKPVTEFISIATFIASAGYTPRVCCSLHSAWQRDLDKQFKREISSTTQTYSTHITWTRTRAWSKFHGRNVFINSNPRSSLLAILTTN